MEPIDHRDSPTVTVTQVYPPGIPWPPLEEDAPAPAPARDAATVVMSIGDLLERNRKTRIVGRGVCDPPIPRALPEEVTQAVDLGAITAHGVGQMQGEPLRWLGFVLMAAVILTMLMPLL